MNGWHYLCTDLTELWLWKGGRYLVQTFCDLLHMLIFKMMMNLSKKMATEVPFEPMFLSETGWSVWPKWNMRCCCPNLLYSPIPLSILLFLSLSCHQSSFLSLLFILSSLIHSLLSLSPHPPILNLSTFLLIQCTLPFLFSLFSFCLCCIQVFSFSPCFTHASLACSLCLLVYK